MLRVSVTQGPVHSCCLEAEPERERESLYENSRQPFTLMMMRWSYEQSRNILLRSSNPGPSSDSAKCPHWVYWQWLHSIDGLTLIFFLLNHYWNISIGRVCWVLSTVCNPCLHVSSSLNSNCLNKNQTIQFTRGISLLFYLVMPFSKLEIRYLYSSQNTKDIYNNKN